MVNFAMHVRLDNTAAKFLQCKCRPNVICLHSVLKIRKKVQFREAILFAIKDLKSFKNIQSWLALLLHFLAHCDICTMFKKYNRRRKKAKG